MSHMTEPIYGIWSGERQVMLETGFHDLEDAKDRVWAPFDAGDESVVVVQVCPDHPERQVVSRRPRKGELVCRRLTGGGIEHGREAEAS